MRFKVEVREYKDPKGWWAWLYEKSTFNRSDDGWDTVASNMGESKEHALDGLKRSQVRDHEERMRAIEAAT
jgi:hypothetical protein